jgi:hypothetical protein
MMLLKLGTGCCHIQYIYSVTQLLIQSICRHTGPGQDYCNTPPPHRPTTVTMEVID